MVCTICNVLFIIILNKHKFVTRYVFYISVCMICAYIESDIVAVFYFMLNSKGSLTNLKLTALRTVDWPHFDSQFEFLYAHHSQAY